MAKRFKIKEAELLDDQIKEQNAPGSTVIPATPEEVSQATDSVSDTATEESGTNSNMTQDNSLKVDSEEAESPTVGDVTVQPETISINVQIPVQQLGQAVAMATGDVRTAELSPDIEAEKAKQAEDANKQPMVSEDSNQEPSLDDGLHTEEMPTAMESSQPVQESLDHTRESEKVDPSRMGASFRNLMNFKRQRESGRGRLAFKESADDKDINKEYKAVKDDVVAKDAEAIEDDNTTESNINGDKKEEPKEKLDFKSFKTNVSDDFGDSDLPQGLAETDDNFDTELGFDDSSNQESADFSTLFNDILEDKNSEELSTAAETLSTAANILDNVADTIKDNIQDTDAEDSHKTVGSKKAGDNIEEPKEKLDFKTLLDDASDDDFEDEIDDGLEESRKRVPCKLPVRSNLSERRTPVSTRCQSSLRFAERKTPLVKRKKSILTESAQKKLSTPRRETLTEDVNFYGIKVPKGSETTDVSNIIDNDDLVAAHERVLEARKKAIMNFHRTMNCSKSRPQYNNHSRYNESRELSHTRPSNSRFNEALRSSVRTSRLNATKYSADSWANNKAIDKYEESQKFNFKELLKNGFLG